MRDIKTLSGNSKYGTLSQFALSCLVLSVSNSIPEQGFSENKYILDGRESLGEQTIEAIRLVKIFINLHGDSNKIPITSDMIRAVGRSRSRMIEETKAKKDLKEETKRKRDQEKNASEEAKRKKSSVEKHKAELKKLEVCTKFLHLFYERILKIVYLFCCFLGSTKMRKGHGRASYYFAQRNYCC